MKALQSGGTKRLRQFVDFLFPFTGRADFEDETSEWLPLKKDCIVCCKKHRLRQSSSASLVETMEVCI